MARNQLIRGNEILYAETSFINESSVIYKPSNHRGQKQQQHYREPKMSVQHEEFHLKNPYISRDKEDVLYHLALGNKSHNLVELFGDVKFVCLGGTARRMEKFAYYILGEIGYGISPGTTLQDLSFRSNRFSMYKIGPVISVSHGMGTPSCSILLHELIKLMYHAGVKNPLFFRLGTCGGIGIEPGTVVVSTEVLNGELKPFYCTTILGKQFKRPTHLCPELAREIVELHKPNDNFEIITGKTMSADDFYEGQGRLDGAFCHYTEEDKFEFLNYIKNFGVVNIEMEAVGLAALTYHAGIKCAVICVAFLDRLKGDQIHQSKETLELWQDRPMVIVARYIKKHLSQVTENTEISLLTRKPDSPTTPIFFSSLATCSATSSSQPVECVNTPTQTPVTDNKIEKL